MDLGFTGSGGISSTLVALFGGEAVLEFRRERIWHAESDTAEEDTLRQILPALPLSESESLTEGPESQRGAELVLLIPAANLRHPIRPGLTRVLYRRRVWLVRAAAAHSEGGGVHLWELKLREI
jgi:hypothetical protein